MKWTGSEEKADEVREPLLNGVAKHLLLLSMTLTIYAMYVMRITPAMSTSLVLLLNRLSTLLLYIALALFVLRDVVRGKLSRVITDLALIDLSLSAILGNLAELSKLRDVEYMLVAPFIVLERCSVPQKCNGFTFLSINVPLIIVFALLLYAALGIAKSIITRCVEKRSKVEVKLSPQHGEERVDQGS
ncbi:MAG TPA: hypothetical protein EYH02_00050 [Ignisphaera aggregans]|uniref:Uncharacterized protein n=1 Tax=Ignisphaera aggregans TaxID=334771 RepID=A0A832YXP1_9CREN|nr:hypothetical protein [Ignisphaera aggregans]